MSSKRSILVLSDSTLHRCASGGSLYGANAANDGTRETAVTISVKEGAAFGRAEFEINDGNRETVVTIFAKEGATFEEKDFRDTTNEFLSRLGGPAVNKSRSLKSARIVPFERSVHPEKEDRILDKNWPATIEFHEFTYDGQTAIEKMSPILDTLSPFCSNPYGKLSNKNSGIHLPKSLQERLLLSYAINLSRERVLDEEGAMILIVGGWNLMNAKRGFDRFRLSLLNIFSCWIRAIPNQTDQIQAQNELYSGGSGEIKMHRPILILPSELTESSFDESRCPTFTILSEVSRGAFQYYRIFVRFDPGSRNSEFCWLEPGKKSIGDSEGGESSI